MANIAPHEDWPEESRKSRKPKGTVNFSGELRKIMWPIKSSQDHRKLKSTVVITGGMLKGMIILVNILSLLQPSIIADSSMSLGRLRMNCTIKKIK